MTTKPTLPNYTWTPSVLTTILTTPSKPLLCKTLTPNFSISILESLLCHYSSYYKAYLRGPFLESRSDTITFEMTADTAKLFVTWLYSGRFAEDCDYKVMFELYVFADKVDVPAMKKDIMTFIHKRSHRRGSPEMEDAVKTFHLLPKSCGLVRWLADRFAYHEPVSSIDDPEFYYHVLSASSKGYTFQCLNTYRTIGADPCCNVLRKLGCNCDYCHQRYDEKARKGEACAYHEHGSIEEWKSKLRVSNLKKLWLT
jgi:hypothetical protein